MSALLDTWSPLPATRTAKEPSVYMVKVPLISPPFTIRAVSALAGDQSPEAARFSTIGEPLLRRRRREPERSPLTVNSGGAPSPLPTSRVPETVPSLSTDLAMARSKCARGGRGVPREKET